MGCGESLMNLTTHLHFATTQPVVLVQARGQVVVWRRVASLDASAERSVAGHLRVFS
jgi:hypothetical protein